MKARKSPIQILPIALTLAIAGSACNLTLSPMSSGTSQVIVITATNQGGGAETPEQETPTEEPTAAFTPTGTFTPTITLTATPIAPTMTAGQELSCVKGPHWILYEWVTKIPEGETVTLLAKASEDWEEYYWVRKSDGTECWAFGGSSTKTGDYMNLPVREAPPLPEVEYTIDNKTGLHVCDVYVREEDETAWGADRLGSGVINPGASFNLTLTAGFYDVLIRDCYSATLYEEHDRPIGSEAAYHYTLLNNEVETSIKNNFTFNVCRYDFRIIGGSWVTLHSPADGAVAIGGFTYYTLLVGIYDISVYKCDTTLAGTFMGRYIGPTVVGFTIP